MAHPDLLVAGLGGPEEHAAVTGDVEVGAPVLAPAGVGHLTPELEGHQLGAVADAEGGDAQFVDGGVEPGEPSTWTDLGPPDRIRPAGRRSASSAAVTVWGTISL